LLSLYAAIAGAPGVPRQALPCFQEIIGEWTIRKILFHNKIIIFSIFYFVAPIFGPLFALTTNQESRPARFVMGEVANRVETAFFLSSAFHPLPLLV
jgi:hypothetical protein